MRLNRRQIRMLNRYPRATRVWRQAGVRLSPSTRVVTNGNTVRVVRRSNGQG